MREEYDYLTDATRDGLADHVKAAASGWDKVLSFIYGILSGEKRDPYAPFRSFYVGLNRGGVPTATWDNDMAIIRQTYAPDAPSRELTEAAQDAFHNHGQLFERYLAMIADGKITLDELDEMEPIVDMHLKIIGGLKESIDATRARIIARK
jgi:hypothetical protein